MKEENNREPIDPKRKPRNVEDLRKKAVTAEIAKRRVKFDELVHEEAQQENIHIELSELKLRLNPGVTGSLSSIPSKDDEPGPQSPAS